MKQIEKEDFLKDLDILPEREYLLEKVRLIAKKIGAFYGFQKISTSIIGEYKRIIQLVREGFLDTNLPVVLKTKTGVGIALRSSGIVAALRAYGDYAMMDLPQPVKLNFEGETLVAGAGAVINGQYEMGFVIAGEAGPVAEAEILQVIWKTLEELGVRNGQVSLRLNAIGCNTCRNSFRTALTSYLRSRVNRLCKNCKKDMKRSPTRILTCGEEKCKMVAQNAPQILDYVCEVCKKHLRGILEFLDEMKVSYLLDHTFFREGTVYSNFIFELFCEVIPLPKKPAPVIVLEGEALPPVVSEPELPVIEQASERVVIGEGGRVSRVAEIMAGRPTDAIAAILFLGGIEKMLLARQSPLNTLLIPKVFLVHLGELAKRKSIAMIEMLRSAGMDVAEILGKDSIKTQLKAAEKVGVRVALILGQKEALDETIIVREVDSGVQETVPQEKLIEFLQRKLSIT